MQEFRTIIDIKPNRWNVNPAIPIYTDKLFWLLAFSLKASNARLRGSRFFMTFIKVYDL